MEIRRDETSHTVRERFGSIVGTREPIPMALWTPETGDCSRLILVGHGGSGSKQEGYVVSLARGLVRNHGCAVCAIDGPVHGERGGEGALLPFLQFAERWSSDEKLTDNMVADWRDTLDSLLEVPELAKIATVGYWGLSMGTIFGLPFVAAEPRIKAAVLGLMGRTGPSAERLAADALRVRVPTLFLAQWDDELVDRERAFELFGLLGTADKTMIVSPGAHAAVTAESFRRSAEFLVDRLAPQLD